MPVGLKNGGNTCFLNASLQALFHVEPFVQWLSDANFGSLKENGHGLCMFRLMYDCLKRYQEGRSECVNKLWARISQINGNMRRGKQEDSMEFLSSLLEKIQEDFEFHAQQTGLKDCAKLSPIHRMFASSVSTSVTCISCGTLSSSNVEEPLQFNVSIEEVDTAHDALNAHFATSVVESRCANCSVLRATPQRMTSQKLVSQTNVPKACEKTITCPPPFLIFSLNRFNSERVKNCKPVSVSEFICIGETLYSIAAVILHHGLTMDQGHYTTCVHTNEGNWIHCDDSSITEVDGSFLHDPEMSKAVYGFIYKKIEVSWEEDQEVSDPADHDTEVPAPQSESVGEEISPSPILQPDDGKTTEDISLDEEEVPGAKIPQGKPLRCLTKNILERWLQCRGISSFQKNKKELIAMVEAEIQKKTAVDCKVDGGSWLRAKIAKMESNNLSQAQTHCREKSMKDVEVSVLQEEACTIVHLTEDDVEGAKLPANRQFPNITVKEMKHYLSLRGLDVSGTKSDLWNRIQELRATGESHLLRQGPNQDFYLKRKEESILSKAGLRPIRQQFPLPDAGWKEFPSVDVPKHFNEGTAFNYLVERHPNDEATAFHTSKPGRRAAKYLSSGFISNIEDCCNENLYYVRCLIRASMNKVQHRCSLTISNQSGFVLYGDCECLASALGRCNHIAALMRCLWTYNLSPQGAGVACTSLPQQWGRGAKRKAPGVIRDTDYASRASISEKAHLDPRATRDMSRSPSLEFATQFRKTLPLHSMLWSCVLPSTEEEGAEVSPDKDVDLRETEGPEDPDDPTSVLPAPCVDSSVATSTDLQSVQSKCLKFLADLKATYSSFSGPYVEIPGTEQGSPNWFKERAPFVTASVVKRVKGLTTPEGIKNFLKARLWSEKHYINDFMQYGIDNEHNAREQYLDIVRVAHPDVQMEVPGLCVSTKFPQCRCSPDGIAIFSNNRRVLIEIKCPFILKDSDPHKFQDVLSTEQLGRFHLKRLKDGSVEFRETHTFYYQIQFSMGILGIDRCHFVTWSSKGCLICTVDFDAIFFEGLKTSVIQKHRRLIVPEYFLQRTKKDLHAVQVHY